jgi:hypothetical protein
MVLTVVDADKKIGKGLTSAPLCGFRQRRPKSGHLRHYMALYASRGSDPRSPLLRVDPHSVADIICGIGERQLTRTDGPMRCASRLGGGAAPEVWRGVVSVS